MTELDEVNVPDDLLEAAIQGFLLYPALGFRHQMRDALKAAFNHRDYSVTISQSRTRLTRQEIIAIRNEYATGEFGIKELGDKYGVDGSSISRIASGKAFSQVLEGLDHRIVRKRGRPKGPTK